MNRTAHTAIITATVTALVAVPLTVLAASGFTDVDSDAFYSDAVEWLAQTGVTKGCDPPDNAKFCPDDPVTRGQMAVFLERLATERVVDANTVRGLEPSDLEGPRGPQGPAGPAGPQGPEGAAGDDGLPGQVHSVVRFGFTTDGCPDGEARAIAVTVSAAVLPWQEGACVAESHSSPDPGQEVISSIISDVDLDVAAVAELEGAWLTYEPVGNWTFIDGDAYRSNCVIHSDSYPKSSGGTGPLRMNCAVFAEGEGRAVAIADQLRSPPLVIRTPADGA